MLCEMLRYKKNINAKKVNIFAQFFQIVGIYIFKMFYHLWKQGKSVQIFLLFVHICIVAWEPIIKKGRAGTH
jgi:hypothetical protein